ncbi:MAG: tetratricopeptide repeat protein [Actinomycetales bacterium]
MRTTRYTPSLLPRDTLERVFVARHHILDLVDARVRDAAESSSRNHTLLVGPRGSGKTHLLSLAYHHAMDLVRQGERLQVSWLAEDPWAFTTYARLLGAILRGLEPEPWPTLLGAGEAELEDLLLGRADQAGPVLMLVENLDQVFAQIGDRGQQRFRHLLQAHEALLVIASTTRLDRTLADQAAPFYGFFTTTRLAPFDVEEARQLLLALAREKADDALVTRLDDTDRVVPRLRAIASLAGSQPRIWATLATGLSATSLDALVDLLLTTFDDLTPYYQERLARLSPHQRLVVHELAHLDRPAHVADLSGRLGIDQRSLAKSISELVEHGWLAQVHVPYAHLLDRRRTYYELAEPLARIAFQLKETRGEPLRLVVDFLKLWFDPADFGTRARDADVHIEQAVVEWETDSVTAVVRQLSHLTPTQAPTGELLAQIDDALAALEARDAAPLLQIESPVRSLIDSRLGEGDAEGSAQTIHDIRYDLHWAALADLRLDAPADEWALRAANLVGRGDSRPDAAALVLLFEWLARAGRLEEAAVLVDSIDETLGPDHPEVLTTHHNLAYACAVAGDLAWAISLYQATLTARERVLGQDHPDTLATRNNLAYAYRRSGDVRGAISLYRATLAARERVLGAEHPQTLMSANNLAYAFQVAGDLEQAIIYYQDALERCQRTLGAKDPRTATIAANLQEARALATDPASDVRRA